MRWRHLIELMNIQKYMRWCETYVIFHLPFHRACNHLICLCYKTLYGWLNTKWNKVLYHRHIKYNSEGYENSRKLMKKENSRGCFHEWLLDVEAEVEYNLAQLNMSHTFQCRSDANNQNNFAKSYKNCWKSGNSSKRWSWFTQNL